MTKEEIVGKLNLVPCNKIIFHNHEYFTCSQLARVGTLASRFVSEVTFGELQKAIPITVNKMVFSDFDAILVLSSSLPHEAAGFAGGAKAFVPGISGPEVVDLFHWAAVLVGIPDIIGTVNNPARKIINSASKMIFKRIKPPLISLNMVFDKSPLGLYTGLGFDGFIKAYKQAATTSSKHHIVYLAKPLNTAVQVVGCEYDEIWTAAKGSYKLQRPGVMATYGKIIIYAPHIKRFHSNKDMDQKIRAIGYHCKDYVKNYLKNYPHFDRNVAAHVINFRGPGTYDIKTGREELYFDIYLATQIPRDVCRSVGLKYIDPNSLKEKEFRHKGELWISDGGKYLYDIK